MADAGEQLWRVDPGQIVAEWLEACGLEDPDEDEELYLALCEAAEFLASNPPALVGDGVIDGLPFLRWLADRSGLPVEEAIRSADGLIEIIEVPDD